MGGRWQMCADPEVQAGPIPVPEWFPAGGPRFARGRARQGGRAFVRRVTAWAGARGDRRNGEAGVALRGKGRRRRRGVGRMCCRRCI